MTPTYAAIHPNMVVPALVHDGVLILESLDIITYLDDAFGGERLIPVAPTLRAATLARVQQAQVLHRSIRFVTFRWGLGRLAMLNRKARAQLAALASYGNDDEKLVDFYERYSTRTIPKETFGEHLHRLFAAFDEIDRELRDGRLYLMSDEVTIADAFWAMKVLRLIECGYPFSIYHPQLLSWFERINSRPSFQHEVMGKNRVAHGLFSMKAGFENLLGIGLRRAVEHHCAGGATV